MIPIVVLGNSGFLDAGAINFTVLSDILTFIETPTGVAVGCAVMIVLSAVTLSISAGVSLKLYERREL